MKRNLKALLLIICLAVVSAGAGEFSSRDVSAEAKWVAHADFDRFNSTKVANAIFDKITSGPRAQDYENFKMVFELDPQRDFHGITAYGISDNNDDAVLVMRATHRRDTIISLLKTNEKYTESRYRNYLIHEYEDEERRKGRPRTKHMAWMAFYDSKTAIYSRKKEHVHTAIDVLDGRQPNLRTENGGLRIPNSPAFFAAAVDIATLKADDPGKAAFLKNAKSLALVVDEVDDKVICSLAVTAKSTETAQTLTEAANGLIAIAKLKLESKPDQAWLLDVIRDLTAGRDGDVVKLSLKLPVETVIDKIEEADPEFEIVPD